MEFLFNPIGSYPKKVKLAILTLIAGWVLHFLLLYRNGILDYRWLVIGVVICVFVIMIKRWARMLCIFFNIAIAGFYVVVTMGLVFFSDHSPATNSSIYTLYTLLVVCCAAAFTASTVFLLTSECRLFFKTFEAEKKKATPE